MTTVHAYTGDQQLLDGPHKDYRRPAPRRPTSCRRPRVRRRRSASSSRRSPGSSGLRRGSLPTGSLVDLTVEMQRRTTVDEVNALFASRADSGELAGILRYSEEPRLVRHQVAVLVDLRRALTTVIDDAGKGRLVRQRVGLLEPARRARPARTGAGSRARVSMRPCGRCSSMLRAGSSGRPRSGPGAPPRRSPDPGRRLRRLQDRPHPRR